MKLKHSFASRKLKNGDVLCKVKDVAKCLVNWEDIPLRLNDLRAQEISLLAQGYLKLRALAHKRLGTRK